MEHNQIQEKDKIKIQNRVRRLFTKYSSKEYDLHPYQAIGKTLYEMQNTFEETPAFEDIAWEEILKISLENNIKIDKKTNI